MMPMCYISRNKWTNASRRKTETEIKKHNAK